MSREYVEYIARCNFRAWTSASCSDSSHVAIPFVFVSVGNLSNAFGAFISSYYSKDDVYAGE